MRVDDTVFLIATTLTSKKGLTSVLVWRGPLSPFSHLWSASCLISAPPCDNERRHIEELRENVASTYARGCQEHYRLLNEFGAAVRELLSLYEDQFHAVIQGDTECNRFDLLIHMATERKQDAKYAYIRHVQSHGCTNVPPLTQTKAGTGYSSY